MEDINSTFQAVKHGMEAALEHLDSELKKITTGKANPAMINGLLVEHYGTVMPLPQVANVSTPDNKTIAIQPWDKSALSAIEHAIFKANLGFTPQNDGETIRINIPPLTQERRIELAKHSKELGEECKISLRNERHKIMEYIKSEVKDGYPEDAGKRKEKEAQEMTNDFGNKVDEYVKAKEAELLKV